MPIVEIYPLMPKGMSVPDTLPRQVAVALESGLGWDVKRFTIHVTPVQPTCYFAKGVEGREHANGHCLIHITCAGGKSEQEHRTIIGLITDAVSQSLGIAKEDIIAMLQPTGPGCLFGGGTFL